MSIKSILQRINTALFTPPKSDIEVFISKNNPKNAADVEYLIKQWNYSQERFWFKC